MRYLLLLIISLIPLALHSQEKVSADNQQWGLKFSGFIKSDFWFDSRQIVGARDNLFLLYPQKQTFKSNSIVDINNKSSFNYSAITSRINAAIAAPDAFGAKASGFLEADFSGISNTDIGGFRLRHAFVKLNWKKTELLLGQYWHPMFVLEVFPTVLALNTGAPFQPFIRSPQIRLTQHLGNIDIIASAVSQFDYQSDGPIGKSTTYIRNAGFPNLHLQMQYGRPNLKVGAAIDFKGILPEPVPTDAGEYEILYSLSKMIYAKYQTGDFTFKFKAIQGENLTEHLLLGGYYADYDSARGEYLNFRSTSHYFVWVNGLYKYKNWEFGIFSGYAKRSDYKVDENDILFARGADIDYCYRIAPLLSVTSGKVKLCFETEYTVAAYKSPITQGGEASGVSDPVGNIRAQFTGFLFF